jgi:hypothetical protein
MNIEDQVHSTVVNRIALQDFIEVITHVAGIFVNQIRIFIAGCRFAFASDQFDPLFPFILAIIDLALGLAFGFGPDESFHVDQLICPLGAADFALLDAQPRFFNSNLGQIFQNPRRYEHAIAYMMGHYNLLFCQILHYSILQQYINELMATDPIKKFIK